jgi:anti-sigma regulatory factor (Ser/Thr protein kinase)
MHWVRGAELRRGCRLSSRRAWHIVGLKGRRWKGLYFASNATGRKKGAIANAIVVSARDNMGSGFASTGSTIVPIAAKRATFAWWIRVAVEHTRTEVVVVEDPRLLAAVGGIVEHVGERVGLPTAEQKALAAATEEACRATFPLAGNHDLKLKVIIQDFPDRIEVTLEHGGEPVPTAGLHTLSATAAEQAGAGKASGSALMAKVDRVLFETKDGRSRMTLVKYIAATTPRKPGS